jgi:pimeloyl-CoA synthetase
MLNDESDDEIQTRDLSKVFFTDLIQTGQRHSNKFTTIKKDPPFITITLKKLSLSFSKDRNLFIHTKRVRSKIDNNDSFFYNNLTQSESHITSQIISNFFFVVTKLKQKSFNNFFSSPNLHWHACMYKLPTSCVTV